MHSTVWDRWAPIAGIVFVVLFIFGLILIADIPDADASEREIADYLADSAAHVRNIIGLYLWVLAGVSFLWFVAHLQGVLRQSESGPGTLSSLGFGAGVAFSVLLMASGVARAAVAAAIELEDATEPAPDFVRMLPQLGYGMLLIGGGFATIVLIVSTSILALETAVLPRWLAWLGLAAVVPLALALLSAVIFFIFITMIGQLMWVLAVAVVLLRKPAGSPAT